jgi:hypothetical protein
MVPEVVRPISSMKRKLPLVVSSRGRSIFANISKFASFVLINKFEAFDMSHLSDSRQYKRISYDTSKCFSNNVYIWTNMILSRWQQYVLFY